MSDTFDEDWYHLDDYVGDGVVISVVYDTSTGFLELALFNENEIMSGAGVGTPNAAILDLPRVEAGTKLRMHSFGFETIPYTMNVVRIRAAAAQKMHGTPIVLRLKRATCLM